MVYSVAECVFILKRYFTLVTKFWDTGSVCLWQNVWNHGCTNFKECITCNSAIQLQEFNIAICFIVVFRIKCFEWNTVYCGKGASAYIWAGIPYSYIVHTLSDRLDKTVIFLVMQNKKITKHRIKSFDSCLSVICMLLLSKYKSLHFWQKLYTVLASSSCLWVCYFISQTDCHVGFCPLLLWSLALFPS